MATLGEMLAELRELRNLTQRELAAVLNVSVGTISNYENGVHFPDIDRLCTIADYFHVTTDYLLGHCESSISPDVFSEPLAEGWTVGKCITAIQRLPANRREALLAVLSDMEFRATVNGIKNGE